MGSVARCFAGKTLLLWVNLRRESLRHFQSGEKHLSIGCHHTRQLSPIVKLAGPVEGTIHHSLKQIMATSDYFLTSPGTGNWYCTPYGTVYRTIGYW